MEEPWTLCEESFLLSVPEVIIHFLFDFGRSHVLCFLTTPPTPAPQNKTQKKIIFSKGYCDFINCGLQSIKMSGHLTHL